LGQTRFGALQPCIHYNAAMLAIDPHPLFEPGVFITRFAAPLTEPPTPPWLTEWLGTQRPAPMQSSDEVRAAVRICCAAAASSRPAGASLRRSTCCEQLPRERSARSTSLWTVDSARKALHLLRAKPPARPTRFALSSDWRFALRITVLA
jgi:hypothetical protein